MSVEKSMIDLFDLMNGFNLHGLHLIKPIVNQDAVVYVLSRVDGTRSEPIIVSRKEMMENDEDALNELLLTRFSLALKQVHLQGDKPLGVIGAMASTPAEITAADAMIGQ